MCSKNKGVYTTPLFIFLKGEKEMKLPKIVKTAITFVKQNDTVILTVIAVSSGVGATLSAIDATIKATRIVDDYAIKKADEIKEIGVIHTIPLKEVVKITWHLYIPTIILTAASVTSIVSSQKLNLRRQAALASMYSLTETALKEYKAKVVETLGEKKAKVIEEEYLKESAKKAVYNERSVIFSEYGETLFLDKYSGRYFKSDIERLRKIQNDLNHKIFLDGNISLNELYDAWDILQIQLSDDLGWNTDKLIDLQFTASILEETSRPYIIITHNNLPYDATSWQY